MHHLCDKRQRHIPGGGTSMILKNPLHAFHVTPCSRPARCSIWQELLLEGKRGIVMTEIIEFETTTDWQRPLLRAKEIGAGSEETESEIQPYLGQEAWTPCRGNRRQTFARADEIMGQRQTSRDDRLLDGMERWGSVYGLRQTPTYNGRAIYVEMPLDHWSWCANPAMTSRICLKKRMSILKVFDGQIL